MKNSIKMVRHRTVIHFYWESFSDFHTNKRSTQFSWWRQRGPPTSLLNRFLRLSRERSTTTMCNFPFIFWWWSGMNQEWKFFRQFSKWVSIPCQLPFLCWSSFSLSYDEICSTYLPQNSSVSWSSRCTVVLKIDPIDSRPHQSFESRTK